MNQTSTWLVLSSLRVKDLLKEFSEKAIAVLWQSFLLVRIKLQYDLQKHSNFLPKQKFGNHTPSISLLPMFFQQLQLLFSRLIFSYILALSLGIWRSGEGNARDYGSSVTSPSVCHERVKLMAQRGVGGLQSLCCRLWKRMPFITDWPSQAVAEASHLISGGWGVALHGFKVNVPVLMKLPWSTGLLGHAMSECPSPCWSLQVCCGS